MAQNERNQTIRDKLPQLIKLLLTSEEEDDNFQTCEQFAISLIRQNRYTSVNGHEVRRRIEGLVERFKVESLDEFSEYFKILCNHVIENPICQNHYETDIGYGIIDFVISLANTPVKHVHKNYARLNAETKTLIANLTNLKKSPELKGAIGNETLSRQCGQIEDYSNELKPRSCDSTLSDWSVDDEDLKNLSITNDENKSSNAVLPKEVYSLVHSKIPKPEKQLPYTHFTAEENWQKELKIDWCNTNKETPPIDITFKNLVDNFAVVYTEIFNENVLLQYKKPIPIVISEDTLLREILLSFFSRTNSSFFNVENNKMRINDNVTIKTVTVGTLKYNLEDVILQPIEMFWQLRDLCTDTDNMTDTVRCLASRLRDLLQPVIFMLLEYEQRLIAQTPGVFNTLINFEFTMMDSFQLIRELHAIAKLTFLTEPKMPSHIKSLYALVQLLDNLNHWNNKHTAMLLVYSLRSYFAIVETWWRTGFLNDKGREFIVEWTPNVEASMLLRPIDQYGLGSAIVSKINCCPIYKNFFNYCKQFGDLQSLMLKINFLSEMLRNFGEKHTKTMHNEMLEEFVTILLKYNKADKINSSASENNKLPSDTDESIDAEQMLSYMNDDYLILPYNKLILRAIEIVFQRRMATTNEYVVRLYRDQLNIGAHIMRIRNVILLEAYYIFNDFYENLFEEIESGESWANIMVLQMQLDDIISTHFPNIESYIRLELPPQARCKTNKVYDVSSELKLTYCASLAIEHIITHDDMHKYNRIYSMLFNVKWSIWKLSSLRFSRAHHRNPYDKLNYIDINKRRLEAIRIWLFFIANLVHFHMFTYTLNWLGNKFDHELSNCNTLAQIKELHNQYLEAMCKHCLINAEFEPIFSALGQFFNLVHAFSKEWDICAQCFEHLKNTPLSLDISSTEEASNSTTASGVLSATTDEYLQSNQIQEIENTYIRLHKLLACLLAREVYDNSHDFLSGLERALYSNMPQ